MVEWIGIHGGVAQVISTSGVGLGFAIGAPFVSVMKRVSDDRR